ncbi:hypothetical protein HOF56_01115 [Candidatus Peribacteria bacterium]|jgi:hypothetical protein|nr:hypothetical protein [Candidatus Peribacteria bacterium]MBT4021666.1 hypothetical protein [Candidatus Peribacteria bacterium]MBT4240830.1 hypothetical protein [Candidatus Peribacteria bacterium]MBT4474141.1 hypothetical protein [Candidatus Peribacteria bacterium]
MPVNILDDDVLDKIGQVEGADWVIDQQRMGTVEAFRKIFTGLTENDRRTGYVATDNDPSINGFGGYNRYYVRRSDGEIIFAAINAKSEADLEKAKNLGFTIRGKME